MNTIGKPKPVKQEKKRKRKKRTGRQILEAKLDGVVREIVLCRDSRCVCPPPQRGHSDVMQCGHLFSRARRSTRWDLLNCNKQCSSCNLLHEHNPHKYILWFIHRWGLCKYEEIHRESEALSMLKVYELEEMYEQLLAIRERQKNEPEWLPYFTQKEILSGAWRNHGQKK